MTTDFYEPWTPNEGDWVAISPSPECQIQGTPTSIQRRQGVRGHQAWETGLTGHVHATVAGHPILNEQGHRFLVIWDEPQIVNGERCFGASYAACEIAPVYPCDPEDEDDDSLPTGPAPLLQGDAVPLPGFESLAVTDSRGKPWQA